MDGKSLFSPKIEWMFTSMKTAIQVHNVRLFGVSDAIIEQTGTLLCSLFLYCTSELAVVGFPPPHRSLSFSSAFLLALGGRSEIDLEGCLLRIRGCLFFCFLR
jgi:hypothetical protein